jgi:hypothetical protein
MSSQTRNEDLKKVLSIGHETSMRGEGLSLREALSRFRYVDIRPNIRVNDIISVLTDEPDLISQWVTYSEDKRTDGGWYILLEKMEIGRVSDPSSTTTFDTIEEAVAYYVVHELDYWAGTNAA